MPDYSVYRFIQNSVPEWSGITLSRGISLTYFILSLFSLLLLGLFYEASSYGEVSFLYWQRILSIAYGVILLILGILALAIELPAIATKSDSVWLALSVNQKAFFLNSVEALASLRTTNTVLVAVFVILLGLLFITAGVFMLKLHAELGVVFVPTVITSRLPESDYHEVVHNFVGAGIYQKDLHYLNIKPYLPLPTDANREEEHNNLTMETE